MTLPEYCGSLAIVAFLLWFAFHIHDNIKACCQERLLCELRDDGAEVGVGSLRAAHGGHLHAAVSLAHWYVGQTVLKIKNGHYDDAVTAAQNVDKFVSVVGRVIAPDLESLPESLRNALIAHGENPDQSSVKSAEAWFPPYSGDPDELAAWFEKLAADTLRRLGVDPPPDLTEPTS